MNADLQARLRQLGVTKGIRHLRRDLAPAPATASHPNRLFTVAQNGEGGLHEAGSLEQLLPGGRLAENDAGACFVVDRVYPLTYQHGRDRLGDLLHFSPGTALTFLQDHRLSALDFRDFVFLDTETTGLAGAGVLAFMVGVAFFEQSGQDEALVVRQFFLRDHGDETAMLRQLEELVAARAGLITFNGRSFDLPLLDNRFLFNRFPIALTGRPHIDLLPPSRRLWRTRLGSCALGSLEKTLLGLQRSQDDVPGWLIPGLYFDYLRSGDPRPLARVFYHNQVDMLSMVTLTARMMRQFAGAAGHDHPLDRYSLARWQADLGLLAEAEANLRHCIAADLPLEQYHDALFRLAALYRRSDRRAEAVRLWEQVAATSLDSVAGHVELAKHFEWHERDTAVALAWTERALALVAFWGDTAQARLAQEELNHRRDRLLQKRQR